MTAPRFRDARAMHIAADKRRPFGHIGQRTPEPTNVSPNFVCAMWLGGAIVGTIGTLLCLGTPW